MALRSPVEVRDYEFICSHHGTPRDTPARLRPNYTQSWCRIPLQAQAEQNTKPCFSSGYSVNGLGMNAALEPKLLRGVKASRETTEEQGVRQHLSVIPRLNSASLTRGERVSPVVNNQGERTDLIFRQGSWSYSRKLYSNEVQKGANPVE